MRCWITYTNLDTYTNMYVQYMTHTGAYSTHRVFSEVPFWNSAEYGILYGIDFILRNSAEFHGIYYCSIPRNSAEFRIGSCTRNSGYLQMKIQPD